MEITLEVILIFDIDGVLRNVAGSYRRALADTVQHFTDGKFRPEPVDIDRLKSEGIWNNDWEASQELIHRYFASVAVTSNISYDQIVSFFQGRYRGNDWNGYIADEPLIANPAYFQDLTAAGITWGFFSGATRGSASFVLDRLQIKQPVLIAMEDAPGKPDPTGLFQVLQELNQGRTLPNSALDSGLNSEQVVIYVGDTVADMITVTKARDLDPSRRFLAVGVVPPHILAEDQVICGDYKRLMGDKGADLLLDTVLELTPALIAQILLPKS